MTTIHIIGAPVACPLRGTLAAWREVAELVAEQLGRRFGDTVRVEYFDFFDPACPPLPPDAELPYVTVDGERFSSGGKVSIPALRRHLEAREQKVKR